MNDTLKTGTWHGWRAYRADVRAVEAMRAGRGRPGEYLIVILGGAAVTAIATLATLIG